MVFVHENKIALRKLEATDLLSLKELKDSTWMHTHRVSILNMTDQQGWFEKLSCSNTNYVLVAYEETESAQVSIGPLGIYKIFNIDWINGSAEIGYDMFEQFRGKGFGKRVVISGTGFCFKVLNLRRLTAEVLENNVASIKVIEAAGFEKEGVKKLAVLKEGVFLNSIVYGNVR